MSTLEFIEETLQLTGVELNSRFGGNNNVREKKDSSLVTDADLASEKIVLDRIRKYYPNDAIISEESGYHGVNRTPGQYVWIVDPLDGTSNFANGFPFFATAIARCRFAPGDHIEVVSAGIGDPIHRKHYLAERGHGARCNGVKISVQAPRPLPSCFLVTGFYYTKGRSLDEAIHQFRAVAQVCQSIRRDGSACLDLAYVAAGIYDAFWEKGLALWDMAAGSLLVSEAGGKILNYPRAKSASLVGDAGALSYNLETDGIIAGSAAVADAIHSLLT